MRGFGSILVYWCDTKAGKLEIGTDPVQSYKEAHWARRCAGVLSSLYTKEKRTIYKGLT